MLFCTLCFVAHVFLLVPGCVLHSYKKKRAYKFTPLGRILYPRYHPNSLCEKWNNFYIHDKTLNSRNEWGNVIPYQIFHSSGMRLAWEFRFCLNLRKLFSRWASLSVRKIESYCARSLPLPWYDNTEIAEMSRFLPVQSMKLLHCYHFQQLRDVVF